MLLEKNLDSSNFREDCSASRATREVLDVLGREMLENVLTKLTIISVKKQRSFLEST